MPRRYRVNCALTATREEYARLKRAARDERLPFATWLLRIALEQMRRQKAAA